MLPCKKFFISKHKMWTLKCGQVMT